MSLYQLWRLQQNKFAVFLCIFKLYFKGLNVFCCDEYAKVLRIKFACLVAAHQMTISANAISLKLCGKNLTNQKGLISRLLYSKKANKQINHRHISHW